MGWVKAEIHDVWWQKKLVNQLILKFAYCSSLEIFVKLFYHYNLQLLNGLSGNNIYPISYKMPNENISPSFPLYLVSEEICGQTKESAAKRKGDDMICLECRSGAQYSSRVSSMDQRILFRCRISLSCPLIDRLPIAF